MRPLVGLAIGGATLTEIDERGGLGRPVWTPSQLLADLELRLGLCAGDAPHALRVQTFAARMASCHGPFYRRSYDVDALGTAATLLAWRDGLVEAGWDGKAVPGAGARIEALAELEPAPPGPADRLAAVEEALRRAPAPVYDGLVLVDPLELWPMRWQSVFSQLAVELLARAPTRADESDLGRLKAHILGARPASGLKGDGSLLLLRAETSLEAADATAALVASLGSDLAIIGGGDDYLLDAALTRHGVGALGSFSASPWRPALQVLPLALEMLFEPRDPYRVLELLTLPVSPFHPITQALLSSAIAEAPGIGGRPWVEAKRALAERLTPEQTAKQLARVEAWLEAPGHDRDEGAPKARVLEAVERTAGWLQGHLARDPENRVLQAAYRQARGAEEAVAAHPSDRLALLHLRLLLDSVTGDVTLLLAEERAGRPDHADSPAGLLRPRGTVFWWNFVGGTERRPPRLPWRKAELDALARAGVRFPEPSALLAAETDSWRRAALLASERLVLVTPSRGAGEPLEPHPFWSEITARLDAHNEDIARVSPHARQVLEGRTAIPGIRLPVATLSPLALPAARTEWRAPAATISRDHQSATSLETLVGCPLRYVLEKVVALRPGAIASLPEPRRLNGTLGHRLVEELHLAGDFAADRSDLAARAGERFDGLLPREAATLLGPGASFDRFQLRAQLSRAVSYLAGYLEKAGLTITGVEVQSDATWNGGKLTGRIDVLLLDRRGREAVLDLKWGARTYRELLETGRAVQLAVYAALRRTATGRKTLPPAGYFSLSRGRLLTTDATAFTEATVGGPTTDDTWARLERSVVAIERLLAKGTIPVTGLDGSPPLAEALGLDDEQHLILAKGAACDYCSCDALCGRRWQGLA